MFLFKLLFIHFLVLLFSIHAFLYHVLNDLSPLLLSKTGGAYRIVVYEFMLFLLSLV